MPGLADLAAFVHAAVLSAFVVVTSVAMLYALISRMRLCRPVLSWQCGRYCRLPIGPSLFLAAVAAALAAAYWTGRPVQPHVLIGYPAGGIFWWIATWTATSVVITEYGIVHDVTRISRAVAWGQVADYAVTARDGHHHYVFFYDDPDENHPRQRLDVRVPNAHAAAFAEIVAEKLDARFHFTARQAVRGE
jgi:hypothetical protein